MILIAELATSHGGNVDLACDMVKAAADAGATHAKIQSYRLERLNPKDPQAEWLVQAHLDETAHAQVMHACDKAGIAFLSTPFDAESLQMLRGMGQKQFKIASTESGNSWWVPDRRDEQWLISWPWGRQGSTRRDIINSHDGESCGFYEADDALHLTAIPLYPTPLECVGRATLLDGYSDHTVGIQACQWAIAKGAQVIEAHLTIPGARCKPWDKSPADLRQIRDFMDSVATINTGVGQIFRERWQRA